MSKDIKKLYLICSAMFAVLLAAIAIDRFIGKIAVAIIFIALAALVLLGIRKRATYTPQKREVLLVTALVGVISVIIIQGTGLVFSFYENPYFINKGLLISRVIPSIAIIIASEIIRGILSAQKGHFSTITAYFVGFMSEMFMFYQMMQLSSLNRFMDLVALTLFPAIIANFYYQYVARRFGSLPNIAFRLITTMYIYFVPTVSAMSDALLACIKLILPIIMLALISSLFEKKKKNARKKNKALGVISTVLTIAIIVPIAMLISCQFRFGALVIATESMTGEINKGDMIIYERYDGQAIDEGQVIVFLQDNSKIVHRVVQIKNIGGELRYYTKGDANDDFDEGYRVKDDIVGLTDLKLAYIGYPTLWLREITNNLGKEGT